MLKRSIRAMLAIPNLVASRQELAKLADGTYGIDDVPYQCQFPSPNLVQGFLYGNLKVEKDPLWRGFGFTSKEDTA